MLKSDGKYTPAASRKYLRKLLHLHQGGQRDAPKPRQNDDDPLYNKIEEVLVVLDIGERADYLGKLREIGYKGLGCLGPILRKRAARVAHQD